MRAAPSFKSAVAALPLFFALKVLSGLALLKMSALHLPVSGFTAFAQFLLLGAMLNTIAVGGAQNGLVRQAAAAAGDRHALARAKGAGFLIWVAAILALGLPMILLRGEVAELLTGQREQAWAIPWIVALALLAGPGQIYCALLTGCMRAPTSLASQGLGLLAGTAAAVVLLIDQQPVWAAIAFYAGTLLTVPVSWLALRRHDILMLPLRELVSEARVLLGYSGAFVFIAVFTSLVLFGVRYVYLSAFGLETLGYWMVAQRVSDTSTQLLGLLMVQVFLPSYTPVRDGSEGRAILRRTWLAGMAVMGGFLVCFAIAPELIVRVFLSERYLPAIGMILAYMAGDVLRVSASLGMHAAFAHGRLGRYIAIEVGAMALFAAITLALTSAGETQAPVIGYVAAYAVAALIIIGTFLWGRSISRTRAAPPS
jgi:O-antigen/teichoic acid export membrane protein